MASFNQSPLGQTASSAAIMPSITLSNSSTAILPTLSFTILRWSGGMTAGGATAPIGSGGGGIASPPAVRGRVMGAVATIEAGSASGIFDLFDDISAKRQNA